MNIRDIFTTVILLSITVAIILIFFYVIGRFSLKPRFTPASFFLFQTVLDLNRLRYDSYLNTKNPSFIFYYDLQMFYNDSSCEKDKNDILVCSYLSKAFAPNCGVLDNITDLKKEKNGKIKIKYIKIMFCFEPAYNLTSVYTGKNIIFAPFEIDKIVDKFKKLFIPNLAQKTLSLIKFTAVGSAFNYFLNEKLGSSIILYKDFGEPFLITDKYGNLYVLEIYRYGIISKKKEEKELP